MNDDYEVSRTAITSLYYTFPGSIFTRHKSTFRINKYLYWDEKQNDKSTSILNEERLIHKLKKLVVLNYNKRIQSHDLNYTPISESIKMDVKRYVLNRTRDDAQASGSYSLYPLEFICRKCHKIVLLNVEKELLSFSGYCVCGGKYEQNTVVTFCETCGSIKTLLERHHCSKHGKTNARINYQNRTSLRTWKIECIDCSMVDIFSLRCNHKDYGKEVSHADPCKIKPLTVRDGGIVSPANIKTVDFATEIEGTEVQNHTLLAIENGLIKKDKLLSLIPFPVSEDDDSLKIIEEIYRIKKTAYASQVKDALEYISEAVEISKCVYKGLDVDSICDLIHIKKDSNSISYEEYIKNADSKNFTLFSKAYESIKSRYHISGITYLNNMRLISSTYGLIYGPIKHYDVNYAPHFEPFWIDNSTKSSIYSISYPFQSEGILIELDPLKIVEWLEINRICEVNEEIRNNPSKYINKLSESSEEYVCIKELIHTLSHILIKKSALYTGLDENTYGELLFPSNYSFIIYSTSTVNIGGMDYLFRYHVPNWFSDLDTDSCECVFDPSCINEGGACYNCLYLPEYVCSNFNNTLSRHSLIGGGKVSEHGFWRI